jgi:hypothetical protein
VFSATARMDVLTHLMLGIVILLRLWRSGLHFASRSWLHRDASTEEVTPCHESLAARPS